MKEGKEKRRKGGIKNKIERKKELKKISLWREGVT